MQIPISELKINPTYESLVPRVTPDEYQTMKHSIEQHGIREPIVITNLKVVIDGHTRIQIAKELNLWEVPYRTETYKDAFEEEEAVIAYNLERRQLNLMQLGILGNRIELIEKEKAKTRQLSTLKQNIKEEGIEESEDAIDIIKRDGTLDSIQPNGDIVRRDLISKQIIKISKETVPLKTLERDNKLKDNGESRNIAAKKVGISKDTQYKVDKILEKAKDNPLIKKEMDEAIAGKKSVNKVFNSVKQIEKREDKKIQLQTRELPQDKFEVIYADPPWEYEFSETEKRSLDNQYPQMKLEDICKMPINTTDDAILFLWTTSPKLEEAFKVIKGWGFTYKTCMVWVKDKIGMGYYARQKHELLLIATKGKIGVPDPPNRPESVIIAPREEHSKKPLLHNMIEKMYPFRKYLELFARQGTRTNWTYWGNEI